jgi:hypothetical protein
VVRWYGLGVMLCYVARPRYRSKTTRTAGCRAAARGHELGEDKHPGVLVAKVGYFGIKSAKVCRSTDGRPNLLKSRSPWPPVC